jgi:hypothetical protein
MKMKKKRNNTATKRTERFSLDDNTCTGVREIPFLLLCAYRDVYLCYIRTTRTHAQKRIGSCPKSNDHRFFLRPHSAPTYLAASLLLLLSSACTYHHPPEQTNTGRTGKRSRTGRRAGRQETHPACFLPYIFFLLRRITIHRSAAPTLCFIMHTYFYLFFFFVLWAFFGARGRFPTPHHRRAREIAKGVFFSCSSFVYVSE